MLIGKSFHFDAAHSHPSPGAGKCHRLHGHTYHVEIVLQGNVRQDIGRHQGMIVDLGDVGHWWKTCVDTLVDHQNLNEVMPAAYLPSTIENLAQWFLDLAIVPFPDVASVRVQEGQTQWAIAIA